VIMSGPFLVNHKDILKLDERALIKISFSNPSILKNNKPQSQLWLVSKESPLFQEPQSSVSCFTDSPKGRFTQHAIPLSLVTINLLWSSSVSHTHQLRGSWQLIETLLVRSKAPSRYRHRHQQDVPGQSRVMTV
jgi:hypothetical protein